MEIRKTYNPLTLSHDYRTFENAGLSPNQFLERENIIFTRPVVLLVNGIPILRKDWNLQLKQTDVCHFVELPRGGGGGSNPLQIVLTIAIIALSVYTGGLAAAAWGATWGAVVSGAIMVGGMMLVNMFFGGLSMPSIPTMPEHQRIDEYNINAGRNTLQIGKPFAEHFGRFICFPALVMGCYTEYISNKQYFYMVGIIGVGEYDIENVYIGDAPIGDYANTSYNIIAPSGALTLCPNLVFTCAGISGQELDTEWLTSVVSAVGTEISQIGFDVVFPGGLGSFNDLGDLCSHSVKIRTEARLVDNVGAGITAWTLLHENTYSNATLSPLRYSQKIPVPHGTGRYGFRIQRTSAKSTSSKIVDTVNTESVRGYGAAHPAYDDLTLIEVKIKATDKLNGAVAQKINVVATRKLYPVTATGFGVTKAASRSIIDACAHIVTSDNGGKQPDSILEFESLFALRSDLATRENWFDYRFIGRTTVMEACNAIARCGRAVPYMPGGLFSLVRDKLQSVPTQVYTDDDYTENSLDLSHIIRTDDDPTCVEIEYVDPDTWQRESITYYELGGSLENPARLSLTGCTSRQHAYEEAAYMYKDDELNRTSIIFITGLKGHIPKLGDMIYVTSRHVDWGQTGQLAHISATVATLSEPVDFGETSYEGKLLLTSKTGGVLGPYNVTPGDSAHSVVIALSSDIVNTIHVDGEKATKFLFGPTLDEVLRVRVLKILPASNNEVRIIGSIIHDEAHTVDCGSAPSLEGSPVDLPILDNLTLIYQGVSGADYEFYSIWLTNCDKFRLELDEGSGYFILIDNLEAYGYAFTTTAISISLKVTPYIDDILDPGEAKITSYALPAAPANLHLVGDVDDTVEVTWDAVTGAESYRVSLLVSGVEKTGETVTELTKTITADDMLFIGGPWTDFDIYVNTFNGTDLGPPATLNVSASVPDQVINFIVQERYTNSVLLSWDVVNDATGYKVYQGLTSDFDPATEGTLVYEGANAWSIIDQLTMSGDYEYFFKVAAYNQYYQDRTDLNFSSILIVTPSGGNIIFCKTFDDAIVSGAALIIRLQDIVGTYFYTKVYPTISASNNGTADDIGQDLRGINDAILSGTPKVAEFKSNSISYYFKVYPTISAEVENSAGITLNPICINDVTISGTPRVARVQTNGVYRYFKVYPVKG